MGDEFTYRVKAPWTYDALYHVHGQPTPENERFVTVFYQWHTSGVLVDLC